MKFTSFITNCFKVENLRNTNQHNCLNEFNSQKSLCLPNNYLIQISRD